MLSRLSINLGQRLVSTSNRNSLKVTKFVAITSVRHESTINSEPTAPVLDIFQDAPKISEVADTVLKFHSNGEPTLESIGLGGYYPTGLIQKSLEMMHIYCDMPWWATVAVGTVVIRLLLVPFIIKGQKYNAKMKEHMPKIRELNLQRTAAKDMYEANKYTMEIKKLMDENGISFFRFIGTTLIPAPIFISMFLGLKAMASTPVESLKEGGLWWCKDLTIGDPYYILPILNSLSIYLTLERCVSSGNMMFPREMILFLRLIPLIVFPFLANFPGIMLCYFITTNIFTLIQTEVLNLEKVKTYYGLPQMTQNELNGPVKSDVFMNPLTTDWANSKNVNNSPKMEDTDTTSFNKTMSAPTKGRFDPPKNPMSTVQIESKKR